MVIAFLSGKGGTGKTLLSVNLSSLTQNATYMDCDVEEPNGHLFFKPTIDDKISVTKKIPVFNHEKCIGCRKCVDFCRFNALAFIQGKIVIEESLCHGCGGCQVVCEYEAVHEVDKEIGHIDVGHQNNLTFMQGWMNVGEEASTPIIESMFNYVDNHQLVFADCPPGAACAVMACVKDADYVVVVAESTLYGKANLSLVVELLQEFKKPFGVILNQSSFKDNPVKTYCIEEKFPILGEIEYDIDLARISSSGLIAVNESKRYHALFGLILQSILKEATK